MSTPPALRAEKTLQFIRFDVGNEIAIQTVSGRHIGVFLSRDHECLFGGDKLHDPRLEE